MAKAQQETESLGKITLRHPRKGHLLHSIVALDIDHLNVIFS